MPDPIQQYYEYLRKAGADVPSSFSSFKNTLSNETSAKQYFGYLKSNNFDAPETFESFANTLGLKKKDGIKGLETTAPIVGEPSAPVSQSESISTAEPQPKKLTYNDIEGVIAKAVNTGDALRSLRESAKGSSRLGVPGVPTTTEQFARAEAEYKSAMSEKDRVLQQYAVDINKPVENIIKRGESKLFFDGDVFNEEKARKHVEAITAKYGGGPLLQEQMVSNMRNRLVEDKTKEESKPFITNALKKRGIDLDKSVDSVFKSIAQPQVDKAKNISAEAETKKIQLLETSKSKASELTNSFSSFVDGLNKQIEARTMSVDQAKIAYEQELKKYREAIKFVDNEFRNNVMKMNANLRSRYSRIDDEIKKLTQSVTDSDLLKRLPEDKQQAIKDAYLEGQREYTNYKNQQRKEKDIASGWMMPFGKFMTIPLKGAASGFAGTLASFGDFLIKNGSSNDFSKWLSTFSQQQEKFATAEYNWSQPIEKFLSITGTTVGGSLPQMLLGGAAALIPGAQPITAATLAGTVSALSESAVESGDEFSGALMKGKDVVIAKERADEIYKKNMSNAALYAVSGIGSYLTVGKGKVLKGFGVELAEELPLSVNQAYEKAVLDGYNKSKTEFVKENPNILVDTFVGTIGMSAAMGGFGKLFTPITNTVPSGKTQFLQEMVQKSGPDAAKAILNMYANNGIIDENELKNSLAKVNQLAQTDEKLSNAGVTGDKAKLITALGEQEKELKTKVQAEQDPAVKAVLQKQLSDLQNDTKGVLDNTTPYISFTLPGGGDITRVMTVNEFNAMPQDKQDEAIKSADKISVVNDDAFNTVLNDKKNQLGNQAAEQGAYTNGLEDKKALRDSLKQKFNLTDADFVAEPFTAEEDATDREALPQSEFSNEQELETTLKTGEFAMLTGMNPQKQQVSKSANKVLNEKAQQWLAARGLKPVAIYGKYDNSERSFYVPNMTKEQAIEFAKEFNQDSVAHSSGLVYQDGSFNPRSGTVEVTPQFGTEGANYFSSINIGGKPVDFKVDYDFKRKYSADGKLIEGEESGLDKRLSEEMGGDIDAKVASAQKALEATGVKITMIDNTADFESAVAERKGPAGVEGVFISDTGEILINKELLSKGIADGRVVWHEASHPVINIVRNTNPQLFDQVIAGMQEAAKTNKAVEAVLNWAKENYGVDGDGVVNDEAVVEMIANLAEGTVDIKDLPTGFKQAVIDFINKIAKALGFEPVLSDTDVDAFKKLVTQISDALATGRDISEIVGAENVAEIGANLGDPVQLRKAEPKGEPVTVGTDYKLSFVKESDLIDINGLIKDIQDKGQKVWFWVADQLGRGMYYDKVIDGEHYLDAGPSYALDPENRSKNIIWASGMPKARAEKLINDSDYIFIISGSPTKSKLFNKRVAELVVNRIKNVIGEDNTYAKFKKQVLKVSNVSALNKLVGEFNSFEELIESPRRKDFLNMINDQKDKKATDLKKLLDKYNAFVDYNELSDDFYKQNGFEQNDIMLVLKPTAVGGKSAHSTYENDILGDVVGVPDRKINSYDIMPDEIRNEYGDLARAQQSQVVAPYGAGVRKVQARKGNLVAEAGLNKQMTSDDNGNYLFYHYSDRNLKTISPSKFGKNLATGRDERPGIGISMYYTRPDILETGVPSDYGFAVRVPENKVYPFNEDPLELLPAAEKEFNKKFPGQAFNFNKQVAFVTQEASKRGYPMTVAQWNIRGTKALRAQTTEEFKPEMYREQVPGTMNQYEYNPEIEKFKPNAKRRGQASVGGREFLRTGPQAMANKIIVGGEDISFVLDYVSTPANLLKTLQGVNTSNQFFDFNRDVRKPIADQIQNDLEFWRKELSSISPINKEGDLSPVKVNRINKAKDRVDALQAALNLWNNNAFSLSDISLNNNLQFSRGRRDLDTKLKAFAQKERELGTPEQEIEQAIRNRFPLMDQARIDEIMAPLTVAQPSVEEKLETVVQPEGKEKTRGMEKRFGELDEDTYNKIVDEAKTYFSQPNKQTEKAAEEFMKGKSLEYLADYVTSNPNIPGAVNVWMAAMTAKQLGTEIDAAKKAGDVDRVEVLSAARANIYNYFASKATEIGQTIQAFVSFKNDPAANQFIFNKILKQLEEKGVTGLTEDQKTEIKGLLDDVSAAPAGLPKDIAITKLSHYLGRITPISAFDVAQAIWYAKILSGITTQSKNFFANIFNTFAEVPIVGLRMSLQNLSLQPMFYAMKGLGGGTMKGLIKAADIMKSGVTTKSEDKFFNNDNLLEYFKWSDTKLGKTFGGLTGKILDSPLFFETSPRALKYVGRALTASDAIFSTANQEAMANMMAFVQAKAEGKAGITSNTYKRVQEILNNTKQSITDAQTQATNEGFKPGTVQHKRRVIELVNEKRGEDIVNASEEFGKRATLTNEPEGFMRGIYQVATNMQEKLPLSRVVIPFTKVVSNMAENMINYSPAGMYRALTGTRNPKVKGVDSNRLSNDERADLLIKSMIGITAITILASKIGDDEDDWFDITAGGPNEFTKKYELMKGGWRPYTITFKDGTKVNYSDWPISGAFSALGTILDTERYGDVDNPSWAGKMIIGAAGFLSVFYDKSLLKGMSDFFDIFKQDGKYGVGSENYIERTAKNTAKFGAQQAKAITMSNFSQQILKLTDEYKDEPIKEAKGAEVLYRDIPILNDGLNPIIDVFGDPVVSSTTERLLPWMSVSDDKKDEVIAYLNRNNVFVGVAPEKPFLDYEKQEERKMTRDELYNYRKLAGQYTKQALYEDIDAIKELSAEENGKERVKKVVSNIVSAARRQAYYEIVTK